MGKLPPPNPPPRPAQHSIFDPVHGIAGGDDSTLDLDGEPTHKIVALGDDDIEVVLDFDTTQPIPLTFGESPVLPTHWSELPAGTFHAEHFNTDGWTS
jgi:hypothetical protein